MLAGLVFCEMLSQYPQSAFQGSGRVAGGVSSSLRPKPSASIWLGLEIFLFSEVIFAGQGYFPEMALKSGLKKTRPFRFLPLKSVVLDWFMVSSCLFRWSFTWQSMQGTRAKTTKFKSDVLETPVIFKKCPIKGRHLGL